MARSQEENRKTKNQWPSVSFVRPVQRLTSSSTDGRWTQPREEFRVGWRTPTTKASAIRGAEGVRKLHTVLNASQGAHHIETQKDDLPLVQQGRPGRSTLLCRHVSRQQSDRCSQGTQRLPRRPRRRSANGG